MAYEVTIGTDNNISVSLSQVGQQGVPGVNWQGTWATSTSYESNDAVSNSGTSYICLLGHTSSASTEPGTGGSWETYWDTLAKQGAAGVGTGDMLASTYDPQAIALDAFSRTNHTGTLAVADGGTGATTAAAARTGLGVEIGADVQAWDADLDAYATKTPPSGDVVGTTDTQTLTNKTIAGVPLSTQTADYTLVAADSGKWITVENSATVTIPDAVFAAGDVVRIYNSSANIIMLKCPITTARLGGVIGNQDNIMVPGRGLATVLFLSATECVVSGDAEENAPFEMGVQTTTASETFTIPTQNVGTFDATVDWGDGSTSSITAYNDANLTHTYSTAGNHLIKVTGLFPNIYFNNGGDRLKVRTVNFGSVGWQTAVAAFYGCSNMTVFKSGKTDASMITNGSYAFRFCSSLTTPPDVSGWTQVTDASFAFNDCSGLTTPPDVSGWTQVTNTKSAFYGCSSLTTPPDVSGWTQVTDASFAFSGCSDLTSPPDVSGWTQATDATSAFKNCSDLTTPPDVSGWTQVTDAASAFYNCNSLTTPPDVSSWTQVTNADNAFYNCNSLTTPPDVSGWTQVTNADNAFYNCSSLTSALNLNNWNPTILTGGTAMMSNISAAGFDQTAYDSALTAWDIAYDLTTVNAISIHFGSAKYGSGAPKTARDTLVAAGWTITDGGAA